MKDHVLIHIAWYSWQFWFSFLTEEDKFWIPRSPALGDASTEQNAIENADGQTDLLRPMVCVRAVRACVDWHATRQSSTCIFKIFAPKPPASTPIDQHVHAHPFLFSPPSIDKVFFVNKTRSSNVLFASPQSHLMQGKGTQWRYYCLCIVVGIA